MSLPKITINGLYYDYTNVKICVVLDGGESIDISHDVKEFDYSETLEQGNMTIAGKTCDMLLSRLSYSYPPLVFGLTLISYISDGKADPSCTWSSIHLEDVQFLSVEPHGTCIDDVDIAFKLRRVKRLEVLPQASTDTNNPIGEESMDELINSSTKSTIKRLEEAAVALEFARKQFLHWEEEFKQALSAYYSEVGIVGIDPSRRKSAGQKLPPHKRKTNWRKRIMSIFIKYPNQIFTAEDIAKELAEDEKYLTSIKSTLYYLAKIDKITKNGMSSFEAINPGIIDYEQPL